MKRQRLLLLASSTLASAASLAADRSIAVPPVVQSSWEFVTPGTGARLRPHLGVGFWQRGSGAKPGVGSNYVSVIEYQLPEAAPAQVRSATLQFTGKPSQCVGAEPVIIEVHAYAGDGRGEAGDAQAGSRVAQLSAGCSDNLAFARPIDVTAIVRQLSVASGIRHVGFNVRKANNRQGPGLFALTAGKLTVVLAEHPLGLAPQARVPGAMPSPSPMPAGGASARSKAMGAMPGTSPIQPMAKAAPQAAAVKPAPQAAAAKPVRQAAAVKPMSQAAAVKPMPRATVAKAAP